MPTTRTYSPLPPMIPAGDIFCANPRVLQEPDSCPHTYGVRVCSCAAFATEPCRPTACISAAPFRHTPCRFRPRRTATVWRNLQQHPQCADATTTLHSPLSTLHSSHTFSAKERDSETGLSHFGSRYYSSDLSIWLSVDPMSGKYPSLSPYVYCVDNPVKLVDPNGEEIYEFDESGKNLRVSGEKGSADQIAIRKSDGSVVLCKEYKNGTIRLGQKDFVSQESGNSVEVQPLNIKGDDNAIDCFKFAVDNSSCEWSLCQVESTSGEIGNNVLSNSQEWTHESSANLVFNSTLKLRAHWHSHPDNLKASTKDYEASEILRSKFGDPYSPCGYIPTYIYSRGKHILYNNFIKFLDEIIENALRDEHIIP